MLLTEGRTPQNITYRYVLVLSIALGNAVLSVLIMEMSVLVCPITQGDK